MTPAEWDCSGPLPVWKSDRLRLELDPAHGLVDVRLNPEGLLLPRLLGVEIVDAEGLGPRPLFDEGSSPEVVCRQDIALAIYKPTTERPVECHARWRVSDLNPQPPSPIRRGGQGGEVSFELEISTLTPGQWGGLSIRTCSALPNGETLALPGLPVLLHRPVGASVSYVEMCHPHDTIGHEANAGRIRIQLFGHDLEKGVILRGRLRALVVERFGDLERARQAYQALLAEPPHLSV